MNEYLGYIQTKNVDEVRTWTVYSSTTRSLTGPHVSLPVSSPGLTNPRRVLASFVYACACACFRTQTKGMATRMRKQYDDIRLDVIRLTREVQEASAELQILDKMASADKGQEAARMLKETDATDKR